MIRMLIVSPVIDGGTGENYRTGVPLGSVICDVEELPIVTSDQKYAIEIDRLPAEVSA